MIITTFFGRSCEKCGLKQHNKDAVHCKHCGSIIYQETEGDV